MFRSPAGLSASLAAPFVAVSLGLSGALAAIAQQPTPTPTPIPIDTVVVTASRNAQALSQVLADVSVLDRAAIARSGAASLADLLARLPGIEFARNGGPGTATSLFVRGSESRHTALYIDGLRVDSQTTGGAAWEQVPLNQIERIEVLRGPAAALYGSDAIGGVVQLFTLRGQGAARPSASLGLGGYRSAEGQAGLSGAIGPNGALDYALSASHGRSDGFNARVAPSANPDDDGFERSTWALPPDDLKLTLAGFVLNKFRGDAGLLAPGPAQLQALTGVAIVGVLPMQRDHGLPDEDGVFDATASPTPAPRPPTATATATASAITHQPGHPAGGQPLHVAVVAYPHISNLDEFAPLRQVPGLRLTWARHSADLAGADWIVLPGSKQVSGDLAWLRAQGLDTAIARHAAAGRQVLGVCGGLQMLGTRLHDPLGVDGQAGSSTGLGLLPLATHYGATKRVLPVQVRFGGLQAPWQALAGIEAPAYEIRAGITQPEPGAAVRAVLHDGQGQGQAIGWQAGAVLGVYAHGLFESAATMRALFGAEMATLDSSLDGLAALVDRHFEPGVLQRWLGGR